MYKYLHGLALKYLAELCVPVADVAGRRQLYIRSGSRGLLNFPRYNVSNYGRRAFCFAGPYVWNSLPEHNPAININSCLQALTKDISTAADIAPSALQTILILLFYGLYKCTDLLLIIITTRKHIDERCVQERKGSGATKCPRGGGMSRHSAPNMLSL